MRVKVKLEGGGGNIIKTSILKMLINKKEKIKKGYKSLLRLEPQTKIYFHPTKQNITFITDK